MEQHFYLGDNVQNYIILRLSENSDFTHDFTLTCRKEKIICSLPATIDLCIIFIDKSVQFRFEQKNIVYFCAFCATLGYYHTGLKCLPHHQTNLTLRFLPLYFM